MTCWGSFTAQLIYKNCTDLRQPWNKRTPPWSLATIGVARHCGDQSLPRFDLSAALIASIKRSAVISQTYDTGSWRQGHQGWPPPHGEAIKSGRAGELEDFFDQTQWSQQSDINLLLTFSHVKQFCSFESGRDSIYGAHKLSDLSVKNSSPPRVSHFVSNFGIILK